MIRSNPSSAMQKTYDEAYLICSTAVYFEKQNNEEEALRSWRNALDNIYYHNAYRAPANYRAKNETEIALQDSLRVMEAQCKERVNLLEALRKSRLEAKDDNQSNGPYDSSRQLRQRVQGQAQESSTTLGQGTIPTTDYPDLARPALPPRRAVPKSFDRPRKDPETRHASAPSTSDGATSRSTDPNLTVPEKKSSRTPSPEKKGIFRSTLRPAPKEGSRNSTGRLAASTMRNRPPVAAKAATLAWPGGNPPPVEESGSVGNALDRDAQYSTGSSLSARAAEPKQPSSTDYLPQMTPSLDLPYRPKSSQDTNLSREPIANKNSVEARRESGGRANIVHRSRQSIPIPTDANIPTDKGLGSKRGNNGATPSFPLYRKEYPSSSRIDPKLAQTMAMRMNANLDEGGGQTPHSRRTFSPPQDALRTTRRKTDTRPSTSKVTPSNANLDHQENTTGSTERSEDAWRKEGSSNGDLEKDQFPSGGSSERDAGSSEWDAKVKDLMKNLPKGVDDQAAKAIFNEIVIKGDEVHWDDVAGLEIAKGALKEAVVYPFLRPDLFMGLREPARGMLLFGPPGTGKTMLARAVATESKSTFFAISASSLTSKFLGESEKLVRALFAIAKALTPSIIFVDEIDSLLSARSGSGEHEATRRIKTEFLIQWSDLAKAAAGREEKDRSQGDASRVLVLAATNTPWAIDEAARRRFVRRQYIPLPEDLVRREQLQRLMSKQKHSLNDDDFTVLVHLTEGFSGSDITALAKDAAMGPLRSLGEQLLHMSPEDIRPIAMEDFEASLVNIRPSVSKQGLKEFEVWAKEFGERAG